MYIQYCVKGIAGSINDENGFTWQDAIDLVRSAEGILSNWWRNRRRISPRQVAAVLTEQNLERHLHEYAKYGFDSPFISLACGAVERHVAHRRTYIWSAIDTALLFATEDWSRPGALFYLWVPTSHNKAVPLSLVAEPVRDLNIYRRWSPYQLEGEVTAKIHIPANQIEKVEWWDGSYSMRRPQHSWVNGDYIGPSPLSNLRDLF